jgi:antitoxin (DNA-binding transcriptional repressor) of toxin-antitoxin stability system
VRELTATEAARRFSEVLDAVEHNGESFVVRRGGKVVASIAPASPRGGRALKDVLLRHRADPGWADEVRALRAGLTPEERDWPA